MFMPASRKGVISDSNSLPFINFPDSVYIQDDQFFPELSQELPIQYLTQEQPRLHSPFEYRTFASPPSSAPSSPASPASSTSHFPSATAASADYSTVFDGASSFEAPSMTPASSYNPSIHVQSPQQQSFIPQYPQQQYVFDNSQMLAQQYLQNNNWENNLLSSPSHAHTIPRTHQFNSHNQHLQTPSSSSGRSPGSSYQQRSIHSSAPTKPLPTPVHTPVQASFLTPQYQKNDSAHDGGFSSQFMADQQQNQSQHQHQTSDHSHAPSVSTVSHNSPVTPQTGFEEIDDTKTAPNDYNAYQDELYNPAAMQTPQVPKQQHQQNLLPQSYPNMNIVANRIQAAQQNHLTARNQSPVGSINRERSPFRQNSPLAAEYEHDAFRQPITSAPTSQPGMNMQQQSQVPPNTISPKDAVLNDFNEGDDHGLPMSYQPDFNLNEAMLRQDNSFAAAPSFPAMDAFPHFNQASSSQPFFPSQPQQSRRQSQQQSNLLHHTPDFPAPLPRFESTNSEVYHDITSPTLSKTAVPVQREITRPQNTSSDSGTYTCTYHGCTQRFETPAKLQKHKREAHRQTTPGGHLVGRDGASRNSQAGPHKCDRINPSTGKPCGSIFSRPYDLTRHEDTIHNARKQKVRCHLCTEEKTFSRNDALTRHMRVVHPDVDWPGKQRRRGGRE
ncbi:hypothetical protein BJY04DRAFT_94461 [Aspergillus karnatakaensis]|uniref:stress-regulated transcription factor RPN4 n=1 Tax=Aspergillus karnatakaensis TaxID=1810916 RepID=UPI003CCCF8F6